MSQKQKSILSFFKQTEPSNTNKKGAANADSKSSTVKSDLKKSDNADSKNTSLNKDSKDVKKNGTSLNGSEKKKSTPKKKVINSNNKELIDDSPIKQTKKRKRAAILESDDDSQSSDELPSKKREATETNGNEDSETEQPKKLPEVDSDKSIMANTSSSSGHTSEQQDEPMDEDQPTEKSTESNDTSKDQSNDTDLETACNSSPIVPDLEVPEFIPKRKTARKQMRSGQLEKEITQKISEDPSSSSSKNVANKTPSTDNGLKSIKLETENSSKEIVEDDNELVTNDIPQDDIKKESETKDIETKNIKKESETKEIETKNIKKESETKEIETKNIKKDSETKVIETKNIKKGKKASPKNAKKETKTKENKKEKKSSKKDKEQVCDTKTESSSDNENCSLEKEEANSPKSKTEDTDSKTKIHPFFGKNKSGEASSQDEKADKKPAKVSASSGTVYDPSKNRYHPIDDACWKHKEKVPYLALAKTLDLIENTSGRLKMIEILSNYFRSVIVLTPEDLLQSVYLCLNRLAPEHEGIELGIGELLLMKALAQATGRTTDKIKAEVALKGDLGLVAESSRGNQRLMFAPPKLTVSSVFSKFREIAKMTGNTVMSKKTDKIQALFVACRECEAKYIIRSLSGKLRIGLAEQSILAALARAAVLTPPNQSYPPEIIDKSSKMGADALKEYLNAQTLILKTTYCECPNYDLVIPVLLKEGIAGLPEHCQLTAGFPLKPMLAHPTNGIDEVLNRFDKNEFTCEFKYDGERAQIHRTDKGEIKIYSRNQEDNTSKYPDVISRLSKTLKETTKSFILDTEAVAWDSETKQILPFQVLSTRKKKDAVESDIVVQVCIMAFDLIYLNGESLVKKPLKERREQLHAAFTEVENEFMFVTYRDGNSAETMQEFLDESIKGNCEGLMVKALTIDASYEIAKRSHNWLKLKKDYLTGVGDTLDLAVIGGYHGKGKRAGTYGGFLLACYDDDNEEFQTICKLGTGFSDVDLDTHTKFFKDHILKEPRSYYRYDSSLEPDVWFDAVQIWEIKCADLSISPIHKAAIGIVDPEKGISLRFPRFLRIREDKTKPEDATVASQVAEMYEKQDQVQNSKKDSKTEEDYY